MTDTEYKPMWWWQPGTPSSETPIVWWVTDDPVLSAVAASHVAWSQAVRSMMLDAVPGIGDYAAQAISDTLSQIAYAFDADGWMSDEAGAWFGGALHRTTAPVTRQAGCRLLCQHVPKPRRRSILTLAQWEQDLAQWRQAQPDPDPTLELYVCTPEWRQAWPTLDPKFYDEALR